MGYWKQAPSFHLQQVPVPESKALHRLPDKWKSLLRSLAHPAQVERIGGKNCRAGQWHETQWQVSREVKTHLYQDWLYCLSNT